MPEGNDDMCQLLEYAKYWARLAAPVKYVDGSWLGGVHRVESTKPSHRAASRIAWQILSEELGGLTSIGHLGRDLEAVRRSQLFASVECRE